MPVADTELLFALNPRDHKHKHMVTLLKGLTELMVPDSAAFEFQAVLRARGRIPSQVKTALLAVHEVLDRSKVEEVKTMSTTLLALQCQLEETYGLSYFDSLIAASALTLDRVVVSDDGAFDRVPNLRRIQLSPVKPT